MDALISLLDVTYLNEHIEHKDLKMFCTQLKHVEQHPAAICIYPQHVETVQNCLNGLNIPVATVINFPHGLHENEQIHDEIRHALSLDVSELDIVIPYGKWLQKQEMKLIEDFASRCQDWAGYGVKIKYILETGALQSSGAIEAISLCLCQQGASFIKTSTGKMVPGATKDAVSAIMNAISSHYQSTSERVGLKIAGGVRTIEQANEYLTLVEQTLGKNWIKPQLLRIGSSQLLNEIVGHA